MRNFFKAAAVAVMVLIVLQTAVLCVFCIGNSDSKIFRLTVGFLGLGLIITPLTLKTLGRVVEEKSLREEWVGFFFLLYMLAGPWIQLANQGFARFITNFNYLAVASASIQLASSSTGFFVTAMIAAVKPPEYTVPGYEPIPVMRGLRVVVSLLLLFFASYSFLPVLSIVHPFFLAHNPFSMAPGSYGLIVAVTAGSPYLWLLNFALGIYVYYRFYSDWLIRRIIE